MAACDTCRWFKNPSRLAAGGDLCGRCDHPIVRMLNGASKGVPASVKRVGFVSNHHIGERCKEYEQKDRQ